MGSLHDSKTDDRHRRDFVLVIQGPLTSPGRSGNGTTVEQFDCLDSITKNLSKFGDLFQEVIISTWKHEQSENLSQIQKLGATIVLSEDEGLEDAPDGANRLRQFHTTLQGLRAIRNKKAFALKIRSDQELDLKRFLDDYEDYNDRFQDYGTLGFRGTLHGLFFFPLRPLAICDFVLLGPLEQMIDFYDAQFQFPRQSFHENLDWTEGDAVRKYLFAIRTRLPAMPTSNFFPAFPKDLRSLVFRRATLPLPAGTLRLWKTAIASVFSVAEESASKTLVWRGTNGLATSSPIAFRGDWLKARLDLASVVRIDSKPLIRNHMPKSWTLNWQTLGEGARMTRHYRYQRHGVIFLIKSWAYVWNFLRFKSWLAR